MRFNSTTKEFSMINKPGIESGVEKFHMKH